MNRRTILLISALLLWLCAPVAAETAALAQPFSFITLNKGMNLSSWFANAPRQPLDDRDFRRIERVGFDHIRMPVNPEYFGFKPDAPQQNFDQLDFSRVDRAIDLALRHHLKVIIDIHPGHEFMDALEIDPKTADNFVALWQYLSRHWQSYPADQIIFELVNEPHFYKHEDNYTALIERLVAAVRVTTPNRLLVVDAPKGSSLNALLDFKLLQEGGIYYAFHFYEPFTFSHQGMHRGFEKDATSFLNRVPYPSSLLVGSVDQYAPTAPSPPQAKRQLADYTATPWNAEHIAERIKLARDWADKNNVPILCGEFGVYRAHAETESRYRWIGDVRKALEANHIGWELWDYTDIFGITKLVGETSFDPGDESYRLRDPTHGERLIEPLAIQALGLKEDSPLLTNINSPPR